MPESLDGEAPVEVRQWVIAPEDHGLRLDKVLVQRVGEFSRTHLQGLIERGCVSLDDAPALQASIRPKAGQAIRVELHPTEQAQAFRPQPMDLAIVHEDDHLLIINKPVGLVVHPAPGHWGGTLLNALLARDPACARVPRAGIVHRLDKDTSGLMLVAKTVQVAQALVQAIAERRVKRHYLALAQGRILLEEQTVDAPIGRDPLARVKMAVVRGGRPSQTSVRVLGMSEPGSRGNPAVPSPGRAGVDSGVTAIECRLHTGRTHQIRVHLAHIGHPLVGDTLYGGRPWAGVQRQALHAWQLALEHPVTGQPLQVNTDLPADLAPAWGLAGGGATIEG